jgi:GNAT superfamily N-acetyltransferase
MLSLDELCRVVCRPALMKDTADMLELTSHIWEGNDYLPEVWDEWLADPHGFLAVAEYRGRVMGIAMLECQAPGEWYLAGLRVHPAMEGRRIAGQLHDYILDFWQRSYTRGVIRLVTYRPQVKHLCERTGFRGVCEFTFFVAPSLYEPVDTFTLAEIDHVPKILKVGYESPVYAWLGQMYGHGWSWSAPQPKFIEQAIEKKNAWLWRGGLGVLVTGDDSDDAGPFPYIEWLGCPEQFLPELLLDYRRLAAANGCQKVSWVASLHPDLQPYLNGAGFTRDWDNALTLFERTRE